MLRPANLSHVLQLSNHRKSKIENTDTGVVFKND